MHVLDLKAETIPGGILERNALHALDLRRKAVPASRGNRSFMNVESNTCATWHSEIAPGKLLLNLGAQVLLRAKLNLRRKPSPSRGASRGLLNV